MKKVSVWINIVSLFFTLVFGVRGWINMKGIIELWDSLNPWKLAFLGFLVIFLGSLVIVIREKYKKYKGSLELTKQNIRGLILKTESLEEEPIIKWLTYHSPNYKRQRFDNLEQKISYLIDVKLHGDKTESNG